MRAVWLLIVCAACGGSSEPTPRTAPTVSSIATPSGADDGIVARVNGRPVYGSCVAAQAAAHALDRAAALDECIGFELLAQEADRRGLASDPEVVDATRTALVNRVVEVEFEQRFRTAADLKEILDRQIERKKRMLDVPETRSSTYIRYNVPANAPPEVEARARQTIEQLVARLAAEPGLSTSHLADAAKQQFPAEKLEVAVIEPFPRRGLVGPYANALFAIEEVGRIYPQAVRTPWGWDVILLTGIAPAHAYTREEAAELAFPEVRRGYFRYWVDELAKSLGLAIERAPRTDALLEELGS